MQLNEIDLYSEGTRRGVIWIAHQIIDALEAPRGPNYYVTNPSTSRDKKLEVAETTICALNFIMKSLRLVHRGGRDLELDGKLRQYRDDLVLSERYNLKYLQRDIGELAKIEDKSPEDRQKLEELRDVFSERYLL